MKRVVVLGTGTNVGKTYVSAALLRALHEGHSGDALLGLKPVETGGEGRFADAELLEQASYNTTPPKPHPLFGLREPISPHLAARREGRLIEVEPIRTWVETALRAHGAAPGWCLIETAGGTFSPLSQRHTNLDLALALEPSLWLLIVPDALGALHDARATLLALASVGRRPDFVIVNAAREPDAATGSTAAELRELGIADPVAELQRHDVTGAATLARALRLHS